MSILVSFLDVMLSKQIEQVLISLESRSLLKRCRRLSLAEEVSSTISIFPAAAVVLLEVVLERLDAVVVGGAGGGGSDGDGDGDDDEDSCGDDDDEDSCGAFHSSISSNGFRLVYLGAPPLYKKTSSMFSTEASGEV